MWCTFISRMCETAVGHRQVTAVNTLESNSSKTSKPHTCLASQLGKDSLKPVAHSYKWSQSQVIKIHFFIEAVKFCFCRETLKRMWPFQKCWSRLGKGRQHKGFGRVKPTKSTMSDCWVESACRDGTNVLSRPHCQYFSCTEILAVDDLV